MNVRKAVIPTAGLGTRFLPVTKAVPKALLPVLDTPVIHLAVEEAAAAGIERVAMVVSPNQDAISAYFDVSSDVARMLERQGRAALIERVSDLAKTVEITYVQQRKPLGNGHAVLVAKEEVGDEPTAVILPDDVIRGGGSTIGRMIEIYHETGGPVIGVAETPEETIPQKGVVAPTSQNGRVYEISGLVEKPSIEEAPSNLAVVGRYVLPPEIFPALERTSPGAGGEIWLADGIAALLKTHQGTAYRFPGELFDTGVPVGMLKASIREALDRDDISDEIRAYIRDLAT
ncbi:MAG: UTP--glucose-1-phosphate uridylyltransferase [Dehalococcoidia bacterium]|nr:UTP--glucose-1-phosphate uridylyltransferase [Dehalococcoidia bacterium]